MSINYVIGDATQPQGDGCKMICHVVNDIGAFGAGFSGVLARKWPQCERQYRYWSKTGSDDRFRLGEARGTAVELNITVCHMIAQCGVRSRANPKPIDYDALRSCLQQVKVYATVLDFSVHMPRIGCGLAGGTWPEVEAIIQEELCAKGVSVTVYDLPAESSA